MAYSIRNPTALLAIFTALAAAAPQRGGWGGWTGRPQWSRPANTWTQQQPQSTFVTVAGPSPTASSPPIIPSSADGQAPTIIASPSVAQPSNVPAQSVTSQGVPTQGSSSQEGPTVVVPTGTATGAQPSATGSNSGSSSGGSGHCSGESCRPGGKKAGIAGANGVSLLGDSISWFYDWSPNPSVPGSNVIAVPMLWGDGHNGAVDAQRNQAFQSIAQPEWLLGFNEPDIGGENSADLDAGTAAGVWNDQIVPKIGSNTKVGSPAPAIQNGHWLEDFKKAGNKPDWDITAIHIYQTTAEDAKKTVDYYAGQFPDKAIWVTEWACVDTSVDFVGCTDQAQITKFIGDMVDMFEAHPNVQGYAAITEGYKLSEAWNFVSNGQLTISGNAYKDAISKY